MDPMAPMRLGMIFQVFLGAVFLGSGCATRLTSRVGSGEDGLVIHRLSWEGLEFDTPGEGLLLRVQPKIQPHSDPELRAAIEKLLLHYSRDDQSETRSEAATALLSYGSASAWARGMEMAKHDSDPRVRARAWSRAALALHHGTPFGEPLSLMLSHDLVIFLPETFDPERLVQDLLEALRTDDGEWEVQTVHHHPFLPFSRKSTHIRTVRERIAIALRVAETHYPLLTEGLLEMVARESPEVAAMAELALPFDVEPAVCK